MLKHISTIINSADAATKAVGRTLFYRHMGFIMGRMIPEYIADEVMKISKHDPKNEVDGKTGNAHQILPTSTVNNLRTANISDGNQRKDTTDPYETNICDSMPHDVNNHLVLNTDITRKLRTVAFSDDIQHSTIIHRTKEKACDLMPHDVIEKSLKRTHSKEAQEKSSDIDTEDNVTVRTNINHTDSTFYKSGGRCSSD